MDEAKLATLPRLTDIAAPGLHVRRPGRGWLVVPLCLIVLWEVASPFLRAPVHHPPHGVAAQD